MVLLELTLVILLMKRFIQAVMRLDSFLYFFGDGFFAVKWTTRSHAGHEESEGSDDQQGWNRLQYPAENEFRHGLGLVFLEIDELIGVVIEQRWVPPFYRRIAERDVDVEVNGQDRHFFR